MQSQLQDVMLKEYGPLMGGEDLRRALGYRTWSAFSRAIRSGIAGVDVFEIPGRRGKFALTSEVAAWLGQLRGNKPGQPQTEEDPAMT